MGKTAASKQRTKFKGDPVLDQLAVINARGMIVANLIGMGWRLAIMVLVPIFVGVKIDEKLDSAPSVTLAAFFIAIFGAGVLIYNTYTSLNAQQEIADAKKSSRLKKLRRRNKNV